MFSLGDYVSIDENGWLVKSEAGKAIGVVCGHPDYASSTISVSLLSYPNAIQSLAFEHKQPSVEERKSLNQLWASYVKPKKNKIRIFPA